MINMDLKSHTLQMGCRILLYSSAQMPWQVSFAVNILSPVPTLTWHKDLDGGGLQ